VDVSTGVERAPGRKDVLKVRDFIRAARRASDAEPGADDVEDELEDEPERPGSVA
jgi:hypothetical protein